MLHLRHHRELRPNVTIIVRNKKIARVMRFARKAGDKLPFSDGTIASAKALLSSIAEASGPV